MRRLSAAILVLVAALFAVARFGVIPFRDNIAIREIEQQTNVAQDADPSRAVVIARANLDELDRIARSHALDPAWYLDYGANCEILGRWQDAVNSYTRALAVDQRPEIYFNRGLALLHLGQVEAATSDLTTAVRFNPTFLDQIDGELHARVALAAGMK